MWQSASHWVEAWHGMLMASSGKRRLGEGLSCLPAAASVPVASMVWIGFQRPPNRPDWIGSFKDSASEKILPRLIRRPASITSCGVTLFSVPIWSSLPQRPQFDSFLAASSIAARSTFMVFPHSSLYGAAKIQALDDVITLQLVDGLRRHHDLA